METIDGLLFEIKQHFESEKSREIIDKAYEFAANAHREQRRASGEPYILHPLNVALILSNMGMDRDTIAAAILHDVIEDTNVSREQLKEHFGEDIALLVEGVTKLSKLPFRTSTDYQVENLRKMFIVMAKDIRVILIKLADRLHNIRTIGYLPVDKQKRIAKETINIYAPISHRLGMYKIKSELEDLSFKVLKPDIYNRITSYIAEQHQESEKFIEKVKIALQTKLLEFGIRGHIEGRPKHIYSIYQKMLVKKQPLDKIYDLRAIRIIVNSIKDCYAVLGIVHNLWKPLPNRFKDYIANPKLNMYQSLHTTVVGPEAKTLEVQIRTWKMHNTAEYGIAAHWKYKEGKNYSDEIDEKLSWLRRILEWQKDMHDPKEFMESLSIDLRSSEVFVFTPKGDIKRLPRGATPVDFAYAIHTEVGHRCVGAIVNQKIVPLDYHLKDGDIVKIITSSKSSPSRDWLRIVKSPSARDKIKHWFRQKERESLLPLGREILEKELRKRGLSIKEFLSEKNLSELARSIGFLKPEELLINIGAGKISVSQLIPKGEKIEEEIPPKQEKIQEAEKEGIGVEVEGVKGVLTRFAKCCTPIPGDDIIGYITRGKGITIHRADCPNIRRAPKDRLIKVYWKETKKTTYPVHIEIEAVDRPNLLVNVMTQVSQSRADVCGVTGKSGRGGLASIELEVWIRDLEHLYGIMAKIQNIRGVIKVSRRSSKHGGKYASSNPAG